MPARRGHDCTADNESGARRGSDDPNRRLDAPLARFDSGGGHERRYRRSIEPRSGDRGASTRKTLHLVRVREERERVGTIRPAANSREPRPKHAATCQVLRYAGLVRASRLVNLLLLLQARGGLTAGQLARELEVSERTIHRDVEELAKSGVPIYGERGPHGGVRLVDGYRTRLTGMTAQEAEALFLGGLPGPAAELGLGTVVAAARLKVLASLPPELRARASRLVERFHLDAAGWFRQGDTVPWLAPVADAVWGGRRIEIDYDRGDLRVTRVVEPLGLVLKAGLWYVVARSDDQMRTYRVSRMSRVVALTERVERPDGFDLAAYWAESSAAFEREAPRVEVLVRVRPEAMDRLADAVGRRAVEAAEPVRGRDRDGWLRLRLRLEWPGEVPALLFGVGADLEVIGPPEVRRRIVETAQGIVDRYAGTNPT
jgi:predicted DNA-binding transcriptional regulator YafY